MTVDGSNVISLVAIFGCVLAIVSMCRRGDGGRRASLHSSVDVWSRRMDLYCGGADVGAVARVVGWLVASDVAHFPPETAVWSNDDGFVRSTGMRTQLQKVEKENFKNVEFGSSIDCSCLSGIVADLYVKSKRQIVGDKWEQRLLTRRMKAARTKAEMFCCLSLSFFWQIANAMKGEQDFLSQLASHSALLSCLGKDLLPTYINAATEIQSFFHSP